MSQANPEKASQERGRFVQFPISLISGCSDLTRDDKWVLISLMEDHWTEEPFYLSYREIAAISGVPTALLSSFNDKKTGKFREGCLERIERVTGYISRSVERVPDQATGKPKGNAKSSITIHYSKIWQDNREYSKVKRSQPVSYANESGLYDKPVSYANRFTLEPVSNVNDPVSHADGPVRIENKLVSHADKVVSYANRFDPLNEPVEPIDDTTNIIKTIEDNKDKEEYITSHASHTATDHSANASQQDLSLNNSHEEKGDEAPVLPPIQKAHLNRAPLPARIVAIEWRSFFPDDSPSGKITPTLMGHACTLVEQGLQPGELAACRKWMLDKGKGYYGVKRPMYLGDVVRELDAFRAQRVNESPPVPQGMGRQQALDLANFLTEWFPLDMIGLVPVPGTSFYDLALQYSPDDWLYFSSDDHWNNPNQWENERVDMALAYARARAAQDTSELLEQEEAVSV